MTGHWRWCALPIVSIAVVLVAAGCSDDEDGGPAASSSSPTSDAAASVEAIVGLCPGEDFADVPNSVLLPRDLPDGDPEAVATAEIEALLAGLTPQEAADGVLVPWPDGAEGVLRDVTLDDGTLTLDFDPTVIGTFVAAPGTSKVFFVPLVETALRVPEVQRLEMVINGSTAEWVEWWQGEGTFDRESWQEGSAEPASTCAPPASG